MTDKIDYPREYDNSGRIENSAYLLEKFTEDAALYREQWQDHADWNLEYGAATRNVLDIFWPKTKQGKDKESSLILFIHGGYWQRMNHRDFSHLAAGLNANGYGVAIPSYTLCPDITIANIINELRRVCVLLYQTYHKKIVVTGHSAGGHLAACLMATNWQEIHHDLPHDLITAGLGISGLYSLEPLLHTPINGALMLDEEQAKAASPIYWMPDALQRFDAWVGGDESNEYHRQSQEFAQKWSLLGTPTHYVSVEGKNHFTVVDELIHADSPMVQRIIELSETPALEETIAPPDEAAILAEMQDFALPEGAKPSKTNKKENKKSVKTATKKKITVKNKLPEKFKTPSKAKAKTATDEKKPVAKKRGRPRKHPLPDEGSENTKTKKTKPSDKPQMKKPPLKKAPLKKGKQD